MTDQPQFHHLPYIYTEDFPEFAITLAGDENFPATYGAWEDILNIAEDDLWGDGAVPIFTRVTPEGFRQFVAESPASYDLNTLIAYVFFLGSVAIGTEEDLYSEVREQVVASLGRLH